MRSGSMQHCSEAQSDSSRAVSHLSRSGVGHRKRRDGSVVRCGVSLGRLGPALFPSFTEYVQCCILLHTCRSGAWGPYIFGGPGRAPLLRLGLLMGVHPPHSPPLPIVRANILSPAPPPPKYFKTRPNPPRSCGLNIKLQAGAPAGCLHPATHPAMASKISDLKYASIFP